MSNALLSQRLDAIRVRLGARAAGVWQKHEGSLDLIVFVAAGDMIASVSHGFAEATRQVPLTSKPLGIVAAAVHAERSVSIASELPADLGSGYWLRAFGAMRSVAVPMVEAGKVVGVISVATTTLELSEVAIEDVLRAESTEWFAKP